MLDKENKQKLLDAVEPLVRLSPAIRKAVWQAMDDLESRGGPEEQAVAESVRSILDLIGKE